MLGSLFQGLADDCSGRNMLIALSHYWRFSLHWNWLADSDRTVIVMLLTLVILENKNAMQKIVETYFYDVLYISVSSTKLKELKEAIRGHTNYNGLMSSNSSLPIT